MLGTLIMKGTIYAWNISNIWDQICLERFSMLFIDVFCSVFLGGSVETIFRAKRSFGVILAILGHFCKTEKARIGAISWADIGTMGGYIVLSDLPYQSSKN